MSKPTVFISYSHKDEVWKDRLETQLRVLQFEGMLETWTDRQIDAGDDWYGKIEEATSTPTAAPTGLPPSPTPIATPTAAPTPSSTPTAAPTAAPTPSPTPTAAPTGLPPSPTPTATPTAAPMPSSTPTAAPTPSPTPTATATAAPTSNDTVVIERAEYDQYEAELRVEAKNSNPSATLSVAVAATEQHIGELFDQESGRYKGRFNFPFNPQVISVESSLGGSATPSVDLE